MGQFKKDYAPQSKIKKEAAQLHIDLEPTKDILASVGAIKKDQFLVGFALETENEIDNAKEKIKRKNLDLIVLNSLNDAGAGFRSETNKITMIDKNDVVRTGDLKSKKEVAADIFNEIMKSFEA